MIILRMENYIESEKNRRVEGRKVGGKSPEALWHWRRVIYRDRLCASLVDLDTTTFSFKR